MAERVSTLSMVVIESGRGRWILRRQFWGLRLFQTEGGWPGLVCGNSCCCMVLVCFDGVRA